MFVHDERLAPEVTAAAGGIEDRADNNYPPGLLDDARAAFIAGFNVAATASAISIAILSLLAAVALRHIGAQR